MSDLKKCLRFRLLLFLFWKCYILNRIVPNQAQINFLWFKIFCFSLYRLRLQLGSWRKFGHWWGSLNCLWNMLVPSSIKNSERMRKEWEVGFGWLWFKMVSQCTDYRVTIGVIKKVWTLLRTFFFQEILLFEYIHIVLWVDNVREHKFSPASLSSPFTDINKWRPRLAPPNWGRDRVDDQQPSAKSRR